MTAHIDDVPAPLAQGRQHRLAHLKHAGEIELQQPLPAFQWHGGQASRVGRTGVVDHHRGLQAAAQQRLERSRDTGGVCQVHGGGLDAQVVIP